MIAAGQEEQHCGTSNTATGTHCLSSWQVDRTMPSHHCSLYFTQCSVQDVMPIQCGCLLVGCCAPGGVSPSRMARAQAGLAALAWCGMMRSSPRSVCLFITASCAVPLGYAALAALHTGVVLWTCSWRRMVTSHQHDTDQCLCMSHFLCCYAVLTGADAHFANPPHTPHIQKQIVKCYMKKKETKNLRKKDVLTSESTQLQSCMQHPVCRSAEPPHPLWQEWNACNCQSQDACAGSWEG
jgi:hypothetical protein